MQEDGKTAKIEKSTAQTIYDFLFEGSEPSFKFSKSQFDYLAFGTNSKAKYLRALNLGQMGKPVRTYPQNIYKTYKVRKATGGIRILREPCPVLKLIQQKIRTKILLPKSDEMLMENCTGFRKGFSIVQNARPHVGKRFVLKLDLQDFFPSISQSRVYGLFRKKLGYDHSFSSYLSGFCTYDNELPQGAPTSPILANLIASHLDHRITRYIEKINDADSVANISYTRYADDITVSGDKLPFNGILNACIEIIESEGFFINYKKLVGMLKGKKMVVTGITVNDKLSSGNVKMRQIRTVLHMASQNMPGAMTYWQRIRTGTTESESIRDNNRPSMTEEKFLDSLEGYVSFLCMIEGNNVNSKAHRYLAEVRRLKTNSAINSADAVQ